MMSRVDGLSLDFYIIIIIIIIIIIYTRSELIHYDCGLAWSLGFWPNTWPRGCGTVLISTPQNMVISWCYGAGMNFTISKLSDWKYIHICI